MELVKRIEKEIKCYPEGSKNHCFLKQLLDNLGPDALRESVRKELNESHADLSESIRQYFKQHIIYTSALTAVDYSQLQQNETARDNAELFHLNLLKNYIHNGKSCEKLKLFEGSQVFLTKVLEDKQKSKSVEFFTKLVEENINEFCVQFLEYVLETEGHLRFWRKNFDSAVEKLSERVAILNCANMSVNGIPPELQNVLSKYYEVLAEGIKILNKLLELFEQKLDCQLNQAIVAQDRSEHLYTKMQCLELEIMIATYSESAVKALKIIKLDLEGKIKTSQENIVEINDKLEEFQILGPEYDQLVEKYQQLTQSIEKQRSAIEYLKAEIASKDK